MNNNDILSSAHSAQASYSGYEYQSLHALLLVAPSGKDSTVYLERFDDVTFHGENNEKKVFQIKFSLNNDRKVTSKDVALWKTIRNWIDITESGEISTKEYQFIIITTRATDDELILQLTEKPGNRENREIVENLIEVAKKIDNRELDDAVHKFLDLDPVKQKNLVDKIQILLNQSDMTQIQKEIESHLIEYTLPRFKESFFDAVYGWWYRQIINRLSGDVSKPLTHQNLVDVMRRQRDLQTAEALPIHFDRAQLTDEILDTYKKSRFVEQLNIIHLTKEDIFDSILHYYKAFEQRSKWHLELQNIIQTLDNYDEELQKRWKSQFRSTERKAQSMEVTDDEKLVPLGIENFEWMDKSTYHPELKLENSMSKIWLWKGSFHMLAQECEVGWHPNFKKILKCEKNEN